MERKEYHFQAILHLEKEHGGAYIIFPYDIKKEFGKGRVKVHATFDGINYDGSIVNMGVKDEQGNTLYIISVLKKIRVALNKSEGDLIDVIIVERK